MIPIPEFMDLHKKTSIDFTIVQSCSATTHTRVLGQNNHKTSQFSSKMGTGFTENEEVGVEIHL